MASQGPNSPSTATTSNSNGGTEDWSNPTNAEASDGVYATTGSAFGGETSYYLLVSNFGFSIPTGATIDGVLVEIEKQTLTSGVVDGEVKLLIGGVVSGSNRGDGVTNWPGTEAYASHGGSTDKWGINWAGLAGGGVIPINASGFGVAASCVMPGITGSVGIDHVRITVYYTAGTTATGLCQTDVVSLAPHPVPPGGVTAMRQKPPAPVPGRVFVDYPSCWLGPPPPAGQVIVAGPGGPFALPPGALLPIARESVESPQAGHPGGVRTAATSRAQPAIPFRPWARLPFRELAQPGESGRVRTLSGRVPMDRKAIAAVVVRERERAGPPGRVQALALPPPPTVRLPTGQRLVVRDMDPAPPAGRAASRMSPTHHRTVTTAKVLARQPDTEPGWLAGRVRSGATAALPRPAAPRALVAAIAVVPVPAGGVAAWRMIDRADPPGALVPRTIVVRDLVRPGEPGRVVASHAGWDFTVPVLTPIFESSEAPTYHSAAESGFNTGRVTGIPVFRARRVP